ncbi:MAG: hypothetical protein ACWGO1_05630 [Anaerolineales bacterium]
MKETRNKFIFIVFTALAAGLSLAFSLLQILLRLPAVISSVSWNL